MQAGMAVYFLAVVLAGCTAGGPQDAPPESRVIYRDYLRTNSHGNQCGIYAAAAAIKAVGREVNVEALVQGDYVSQLEGSTAADLVRLFRDHSLQPIVIRRMHGSGICFSQDPLLIHLDGSRRVEGTHHWIAVLGMRNGKPWVFDPPHAPQSVDFADILAYTSGLAIQVSGESTGASLIWISRLELLVWLGLIGVLVYLTECSTRKFNARRRHRWRLVGLTFSAVVVSGIQLAVPWSGFLTHWVSLGNFREIYQPLGQVRSTDYPVVAAGVARGAVNFVDARLPDDFGRGHIPGAINWPIDASSIESRKAMECLDRAKPVIVYCQSENCAWGKEIASRLMRRGVADVTVYQGGWQEWQKNYQSPAR